MKNVISFMKSSPFSMEEKWMVIHATSERKIKIK